MTTPRPSLLDLHPVEALLALLLISVAALHRLVADPPRPMRRRKRFYALDEVDSYPVGVPYSSAAIAMPAPGVDPAPAPTVAELRRMVRARGLSFAGGRPIHKARRADLIDLLCS